MQHNYIPSTDSSKNTNKYIFANAADQAHYEAEKFLYRKEYMEQWRKDNPDKISDYNHTYYMNHQTELQQKARAYYWEHREEILEKRHQQYASTYNITSPIPTIVKHKKEPSFKLDKKKLMLDLFPSVKKKQLEETVESVSNNTTAPENHNHFAATTTLQDESNIFQNEQNTFYKQSSQLFFTITESTEQNTEQTIEVLTLDEEESAQLINEKSNFKM